MVPVLICVALGTVVPTVVVVQVAVSAVALAVGSSTSTKTMMDRMSETMDAAEAEKKARS
jgi:methanogenic corrinoid protein MtbC1